MTPSAEKEKRRDSLISADDNRAMFDRIAGWYDGTNRLLSLGFDRYWRRRAIAALAPQPGSVHLDVGCGTADVALEIVRFQPESYVIGVDRSEGMLALGREKVHQAGLANRISLLEGDALDLQFRDNSFAGVITSFCIRNVTHRQRALREFHRVLAPGGRLVILELTDPQNALMKPLFRIYSNIVMPLVTKIMSSASAYRYLTDSMADFPSPDRFTSIIEESGFVEATHAGMTGGITTLFTASKSPLL
jgi:demethylmenaquinone methyltransferase/2-methoxy-6-polyprenyl-1,4-benzoquinol methylase